VKSIEAIVTDAICQSIWYPVNWSLSIYCGYLVLSDI